MPNHRRIVRIHNGTAYVALEAHIPTEARLHDAIAEHPEVLPHEDLGLGPLIPLAKELDFGAGPMDLLVADTSGRLAIVEFKRGTENPDVRHVVAQILDYGASLWRRKYEDLEKRCRSLSPGFAGQLDEHAAARHAALEQSFDAGAFRNGVMNSLDSGAFAFVYCGRNLDERTRRIMTYLAEGPRMTFFAVEVDYYSEGAGDSAVLVPRTAFVPSWIAGPAAPARGGGPIQLKDASPEFLELVRRMNQVKDDMGLQAAARTTGWNYLPQVVEDGIKYATSGIGVYASGRGVEINLSILRDLDHEDTADAILASLEAISGSSVRKARGWPCVPCAAVLQDWSRARTEIIEPYFRARGDASRE